MEKIHRLKIYLIYPKREKGKNKRNIEYKRNFQHFIRGYKRVLDKCTYIENEESYCINGLSVFEEYTGLIFTKL